MQNQLSHLEDDREEFRVTAQKKEKEVEQGKEAEAAAAAAAQKQQMVGGLGGLGGGTGEVPPELKDPDLASCEQDQILQQQQHFLQQQQSQSIGHPVGVGVGAITGHYVDPKSLTSEQMIQLHMANNAGASIPEHQQYQQQNSFEQIPSHSDQNIKVSTKLSTVNWLFMGIFSVNVHCLKLVLFGI